jgi:hypothetical protein
MIVSQISSDKTMPKRTLVNGMDHMLWESMEGGLKMTTSDLSKVTPTERKIECKKYYRKWKTIQSAFPYLSVEERTHATAFFIKINTTLSKTSILEFMQKNSLEYFKKLPLIVYHRSKQEDNLKFPRRISNYQRRRRSNLEDSVEGSFE